MLRWTRLKKKYTLHDAGESLYETVTRQQAARSQKAQKGPCQMRENLRDHKIAAIIAELQLIYSTSRTKTL